MRIDGTNSAQPRNVADALGELAQGAARAGKTAPDQPTQAAAMEHSQQKYVDAAMSASDVNLQAVEEARSLLASGALDSPDALRRAAQNMLDRGL